MVMPSHHLLTTGIPNFKTDQQKIKKLKWKKKQSSYDQPHAVWPCTESLSVLLLCPNDDEWRTPQDISWVCWNYNNYSVLIQQ